MPRVQSSTKKNTKHRNIKKNSFIGENNKYCTMHSAEDAKGISIPTSSHLYQLSSITVHKRSHDPMMSYWWSYINRYRLTSLNLMCCHKYSLQVNTAKSAQGEEVQRRKCCCFSFCCLYSIPGGHPNYECACSKLLLLLYISLQQQQRRASSPRDVVPMKRVSFTCKCTLL